VAELLRIETDRTVQHEVLLLPVSCGTDVYKPKNTKLSLYDEIYTFIQIIYTYVCKL
jgi:hypothetical protein